ncbi:MAG: HD domain-containing protein [Dehalococcoidia bacterium]|nr:HD domain-containing protein [Dehalococcoidia bacterium]
MNRKEALNSILTNVQDESVVRHMFATEAIMRTLARKLGEHEEEWGLTGLLHDIDMELIEGDMSIHSRLGADIARELGASEAMAHAILCHNEAHGIPRETRLDKALFCADTMSSLIADAALVQPDKLNGLTAGLVMECLQEKKPAAGVDTKKILSCQEIGLELEEAITLSIEAMKGIASALQL